MKLRDGTLLPAYGRDYKSKKAALADFLADKDFLLACGPGRPLPINRSQLRQEGVRSIRLRYDNARKLMIVSIKALTP